MNQITMTITGLGAEHFEKEFKTLANAKGYFSLVDLQRQAQAHKAGKAEIGVEVVKVEPSAGYVGVVKERAPEPEEEQLDLMPKSDDLSETSTPERAAEKPNRGRKTTDKVKAEELKKELTPEDVAGALRKLSADQNVHACRVLLAHFGAKKASEVPADKREDFITAANDFYTFLGHNPESKKVYKAAVEAAEKAEN